MREISQQERDEWDMLCTNGFAAVAEAEKKQVAFHQFMLKVLTPVDLA